MGIGMARKTANGFGARVGFALAFGLVLILAPRAQEAARPAAPPPLSSACDVPAADIAAPVPLPNFAAALKERKSARILAMGSSSTAGPAPLDQHDLSVAARGDSRDGAQGRRYQIVSGGVSGEVAEIAAERIPSEVAVNKPDLVLWQLGTNDALARLSPEEFEATVRSAIRWLKENKIDIVLVGMRSTPRLARDANYSAIRGSLQRAASAENVLYVRRYDAIGLSRKRTPIWSFCRRTILI